MAELCVWRNQRMSCLKPLETYRRRYVAQFVAAVEEHGGPWKTVEMPPASVQECLKLPFMKIQEYMLDLRRFRSTLRGGGGDAFSAGGSSSETSWEEATS